MIDVSDFRFSREKSAFRGQKHIIKNCFIIIYMYFLNFKQLDRDFLRKFSFVTPHEPDT